MHPTYHQRRGRVQIIESVAHAQTVRCCELRRIFGPRELWPLKALYSAQNAEQLPTKIGPLETTLIAIP